MFQNRANITNVVHFPVLDDELEDYVNDLIQAASQLDKMINEMGEIVFIHCTTGISRAPTLFIVYLAIYCRHKLWEKPDALAAFVLEEFPWSSPNMQAVRICIDKCRALQAKNKIRYETDLKNKQAEKEEAERRRRLKKAQDEAERLRLKRLAEQEAEALRLQKLAFKERERALRAQYKD
jgi:hypothetical protein